MAGVEGIRARIDADLKKPPGAVLSKRGLWVPNAETHVAMRDVRKGRITPVSSVAALIADLDSDG